MEVYDMKATFSATQRMEYMNQMSDAQFDVLIIGGGITGPGLHWTRCLVD